MRRVKTIQVEGRGEVTVREVSIKGVYQAWESEDMLEQMKGLVDEAVSPGFEELSNWYPSEIETVVDALLEVNSSFLGIAGKLKLKGVIEGTLATIGESLPKLFVSSLSEVT